MAIDREAVCKAIYAGYAKPAAVPIYGLSMEKNQYPYDPVEAKQLLKDAGYPNGFSFRVISYLIQSAPETPRLMEALAGYWQQIGLQPQIVTIDWNTYNTKNIKTLKTAGDVFMLRQSTGADMLARAELFFMPNVTSVLYQDVGSVLIYNGNPRTNP